MKITFNQVLNMYNTLTELKSKNFKISYWISRNIKILNEPYSFAIKERADIYEEYLELDENHRYFTIENDTIKFNLKEKSAEYAEKFQERINELFNTDCEIEPYLIDINVLMESDLEITTEQIMTIDCLFKE